MLSSATTDSEAQSMNDNSMDDDKFEDLRKLIPTPDSLKGLRLIPAEFEKVKSNLRFLSNMSALCCLYY